MSTMASYQHLKIQTAELLIGYTLAPASCPTALSFLEYPKMVLFCLDVEVLPITAGRGTRWEFTGIINRAVTCLNSHRRSRAGVIIIISREGSWETAYWKYGKAKGGRVHSLSFFKVFLFLSFFGNGNADATVLSERFDALFRLGGWPAGSFFISYPALQYSMLAYACITTSLPRVGSWIGTTPNSVALRRAYRLGSVDGMMTLIYILTAFVSRDVCERVI
ncbi:hypothetical protein F4806DRAFT_97714 [Annulohypoxylon nitens]|nr:hypothetical protein F4806DRAFT_97714 [Annulohypoxylon nitens]